MKKKMSKRMIKARAASMVLGYLCEGMNDAEVRGAEEEGDHTYDDIPREYRDAVDAEIDDLIQKLKKKLWKIAEPVNP